MTSSVKIIVNNIKLPISASFAEAFSVAQRKLKSAGISARGDSFSIYRRSVDARVRSDIKYVYSVACALDFTPSQRKLEAIGAQILTEGEVSVSFGDKRLSSAPLVVGSGPCGLFAGLLLAENGYNPIILERGGSVEQRRAAIDRLKKFRILDTETNIQFGAGGAGTFSDGKLVTRVNDPLVGYVLSRFIEFGAPEEIKYIAKPHIGTDILAKIVDGMLEYIESKGAKVHYNTKFLSANYRGGEVYSVNTTSGEIKCGALILATGHSARDTYERLIGEGFPVISKDFSVGMRIEHKTEDIDKAMYGDFAGYEGLGHAE